MMFKLLGLSLFFATSLFGQKLSYGFLGGVPFNDLTNGIAPTTAAITGPITGVPSGVSYSTADKSGRYTLGPTVQLSLPLGFRLEADALYRPLGITGATAAQWRFPILAQYRFSAPVLKPFVEAGYSYDHVNLNVMRPNATTPLTVSSHQGFVVGAGLDFKIPFLRVSPEIRYTHDTGAAKVGNLLNTNQAEILVGLRF